MIFVFFAFLSLVLSLHHTKVTNAHWKFDWNFFAFSYQVSISSDFTKRVSTPSYKFFLNKILSLKLQNKCFFRLSLYLVWVFVMGNEKSVRWEWATQIRVNVKRRKFFSFFVFFLYNVMTLWIFSVIYSLVHPLVLQQPQSNDAVGVCAWLCSTSFRCEMRHVWFGRFNRCSVFRCLCRIEPSASVVLHTSV